MHAIDNAYSGRLCRSVAKLGLSHFFTHLTSHLISARAIAQDHSRNGCAQWAKVADRILVVDL